MAALVVKQARKWREQLNGFQLWLAGYVIFSFLLAQSSELKNNILARWIWATDFSPQKAAMPDEIIKMLHFAPWDYKP